MMTPAEILYENLKPDGRPERQLKQYEAFKVIFAHPINGYLNKNRLRGSISVDRWGTTILFPEDAPGPTPHVTEENKVCKDITRWRDYVHAPDLYANCMEGWEAVIAEKEEAHRNGRLVAPLMGTGIFEQCHFLMGFEDTLTNFYEHPQEMHELIDYIFEYRLGYVKLLIDKLHPDAILSHDDWGTKNALFMQPDIWREFFKEPYRKFYGYIREQGVIAIHHADSYLVPIVEDMIEIGIQIWQGTLPENDIPALQRRIGGRMVLMGGIGAAIDRKDATEPEIRAYVSRTLAQNCPGGHYIPCITYGGPGTVFTHVDPFIDDEIDKYNQILHTRNYRAAEPVRRLKETRIQQQVAVVQEEVPQDGILSKIALALQKGQKKRVLKYCSQAVEEGLDAQKILSEGLVEGMSRLGDDFTAGKVFVPEMLMAARCMTAATDQLKPLLAGAASEKVGKVVLGTVKGDMHDIGKNLVKIMMEGSGLEVIDLGTDVPAENFVDTVLREKCDIIACSALLTTTMPEMRRVVELAQKEGIRDQVKIMVGGAPITQAFCDEIGADLYTSDAASAAKAAVHALAV